MPKSARLFGSPLHPMLTDLPVGLLVSVPVWDGLALLRGRPFDEVAFWVLVAGLVASIPAAAAGFWDLAALPEGDPAGARVLRHAGIVGLALCVYLSSLVVRRSAGLGELAQLAAPALSLLGLVLLAAGGRLGGKLVFQDGLGTAQRGSAPAARGGARRKRGGSRRADPH